MGFKKEIGRKLIHISWIIPLILYLYVFKSLLFLLILFLVFFIADILRIYFNVKLPLLHLLRKKEKKRFFAPTTTTFAIFLAFLLFREDIAITSVLMMVFGDTIAAIIGIKFGKIIFPLNKAKKIEGLFAEFIVDVIIGLLILKNYLIAIMMSLIATFVEGVNKKYDDNMLIILSASTIGTILLFILS